jgi:hypothetical protein
MVLPRLCRWKEWPCSQASPPVFHPPPSTLWGAQQQENRRLTMACCLLLAFKLNEQQENVGSAKTSPGHTHEPGPGISDIWDPIEDTLVGVPRRLVFCIVSDRVQLLQRS